MRERMVNFQQVKVASSPTILKTSELGSCVAVALYDKEMKVGALGHILLPYQDNGKKKDWLTAGKFADSAIWKMVEKMQRVGCDIENIRAKIIGGAQFFGSPGPEKSSLNKVSIGKENVKVAKKVLKKYGIPVVAIDVGGDYARRIRFYSHTGKCIVESTKNGCKEI